MNNNYKTNDNTNTNANTNANANTNTNANANTNANTPPTDNCQAQQVQQFNTMLEQARERNACDPQCQHRKMAQQLKEKYMQKIKNEKTCSQQVDQAKKEFIVFAKGQEVYNEVMDEELRNKAQEIGKKMIDNFNKEGKRIHSDITSYTVLLLNYKNVLDLYKTYKKENAELKKQIREDANDILTNHRKSWYENQESETLDAFYYALTILYVIILVVFIGSMFMIPSDMKLTIKLGILVGLIALYFISPYILSFIISVVYAIYNKLPKNVNLNVST